MELGNHGAFPLQYVDGKLPSRDSDIALSVLYAEEMDKKVGDKMVLLTDKGENSSQFAVFTQTLPMEEKPQRRPSGRVPGKLPGVRSV